MRNIKAKFFYQSRTPISSLTLSPIQTTLVGEIPIKCQFKSWILFQEITPEGVNGVVELHDFDWRILRMENVGVDYRRVSPESLSKSFFESLGITAFTDYHETDEMDVIWTEMEFLDEHKVVYQTLLKEEQVEQVA